MEAVEIESEVGEKVCRTCKRSLPMTSGHFHRTRNSPDGWHAQCKSCRAPYRAALRAKNRDAYLAQERAWHAKNVESRNARGRRRWANDPEWRARQLAANKEWHRTYAWGKRQSNREWRAKNPDKVKATLRKQYEKDPLRYLISNQIAATLKKAGTSKQRESFSKLLGYTADDLRAHLERQFTKKMTWDNHGTYWEIDHIVPLASFKITSPHDPEFKAAWALTNLRPLPAKLNRSKGAKRTLLI
ncbi:MAG TPA: hypothetical protein VM434_10105 [Beijerinckiaceae bacterium]|nr:hypothetical protein [Beijerinckiaceae bacterium]